MRVAGEVVVALVVAAEPVAEEGAHALAPLALAAGGSVRGEGGPGVSFASAGSRPAASPLGTASWRGAPCDCRAGSSLQARW